MSTLVRWPRRPAASVNASSTMRSISGRVYRSVSTAEVDSVGFLAALRSPEVEAAGQLAHDQDVRARAGPPVAAARPPRATRGRGRAAGSRTVRATSGGRAARPPGARRPTDRPRQDRRRPRAAPHRPRGRPSSVSAGSGWPSGIHRRSADELLVPAHREAEALARRRRRSVAPRRRPPGRSRRREGRRRGRWSRAAAQPWSPGSRRRHARR